MASGRLSYVLLVVSLMVGCRVSLTRALGEGEIRGSVTVLLPEGGEEAADGARVRIDGSGYSTTVDARGRFVFRNVPPGKYRLKLRHERTVPGGEVIVSALSVRATVQPEDALDLGKLSVKALGAVGGTVTDALGGPGLARVVIDGEASGDTGEGGLYALERLESGSKRLSVLRVVDDVTTLFDGPMVDVPPRARVTKDFSYGDLVPATGGVLSVRARLTGATDHSGITFTLRGGEAPIVLAPTGPDGAASGEVPAGVYTIEAAADGYLVARLALVTVRGPTDVPDLLLTPASCVTDTANPLCAGLSRDDTDGDGVVGYLDECPEDPLDRCRPTRPPEPAPVVPSPEWDAEMSLVVNAQGGATLRGSATAGATVRIYRVASTELGAVDGRCPGELVAELLVEGEPGTVVEFEVPIDPNDVTANETNYFRAQAEFDGAASACSEHWTLYEDSLPPQGLAFAPPFPESPTNDAMPLWTLSVTPETDVDGEASPVAGELFLDIVACEAGASPLVSGIDLTSGSALVTLGAGILVDSGTSVFAFRATDALGNVSSCVESPAFVLDLDAPVLERSDVRVDVSGDNGFLRAPGTLDVSSTRFGTEDAVAWDYRLVGKPASDGQPCERTGASDLFVTGGGLNGPQQLSFSPLGPVDGWTAVLCVSIRDHVGNASDFVQVGEWTLDDTPPMAPVFVGGLGPSRFAEAEIQLSAGTSDRVELFMGESCAGTPINAIESDGINSASLRLPPGIVTADGMYSLSARTVDRAGGPSLDCVSAIFELDTRPPDPAGFTVEVLSPNVGPERFVKSSFAAPDYLSWSVAQPAAGEPAVLVEWNWVSPFAPELPCVGSGLLGLALPLPFRARWDEEVSGLPDGELVLCMSFEDDAGNRSGPTEMTRVTVDGTAPEFPDEYLEVVAGDLVATVSFVDGTDSGSGVVRHEVVSCEGSGCELPSSGDTLMSGAQQLGLAGCTTYRFGVRAVDAIGNTSPWRTREVVPTVPPVQGVAVREVVGSLEVAWDAPPDFLESIVCVGSGPDCFATELTRRTVLAPRTTATFSGPDLPVGASFVSVRARTASGCLGRIGPSLGLETPSLVEGPLLVGQAGERFGSGVSRAGDLIGLGREQFLVGAPGGAAGKGLVTLVSTDETGNLTRHTEWVLEGENAGDDFGFHVALHGDLDGDGVSEIAVGAPGYDGVPGLEDAGAIYVFNGRTRALVRRIVGTEGRPVDKLRSGFGEFFVGEGDLDCDGTPDLLASVPRGDVMTWCRTLVPPDREDTGYLLVLKGTDGTGYGTKTNCEVGYGLGASVDVIGDYTGPAGASLATCDDFVFGSNNVAGLARTNYGFGRFDLASFRNSTGVLQTPAGIDPANPATINFVRDDTVGTRRLGYHVANVGDLDGDGFTEVAAGAPGGPEEGVMVARATVSTWNTAFAAANRGLVTPLALGVPTLTGTEVGEDRFGGFGSWVGPYTDVNADGRMEFLVGNRNRGELYVVSYMINSQPQLLARFDPPGPGAWHRAALVPKATDLGFPALVRYAPDANGGAGALRVILPSASFPAARGTSVTIGRGPRGRHVEPLADVVAGDTVPLRANRSLSGAQLPFGSSGNSILLDEQTPSPRFLAGAVGGFFDLVRFTFASLSLDTFVRVVPGWVSHATTPAAPPDFGTHVLSLGDAFPNGPDCYELLVTAPFEGNFGRGLARVLSCDGSMLWEGGASSPVGGRFGAGVAVLGDVTGDGFNDFAIGVPGFGSGRVEIWSLDSLVQTSLPYVLSAPVGAVRFGEALMSDGRDRNADGCIDLWVGDTGHDAERGRVHMVCAQPGNAAGFDSPSAGWVPPVGTAPGDRFGAVIAIAGDPDGDGDKDVAIAYGSGCNGNGNGGFSIHDFSGATVLLECPVEPSGLGASFQLLGESNGEPGDELAVGAPFDGGNGAVYTYGRPVGSPVLQQLARFAAPRGVDRFGRAMTPMRWQGSGTAFDAVVGARVPGFPESGAVFVVDPLAPPYARRLMTAASGDALATGSALDVAPDGPDADAEPELVIGAPSADGLRAGRIYLRRSEGGPSFAATRLQAPVVASTILNATGLTMQYNVPASTSDATLTYEVGRVGESVGTVATVVPSRPNQFLPRLRSYLIAGHPLDGSYWIRIRYELADGTASEWSARWVMTPL